jgi:hypothetical protein
LGVIRALLFREELAVDVGALVDFNSLRTLCRINVSNSPRKRDAVWSR